MADSEQLLKLFQEWQQAQDGRSPEEICKDHPALLDELRMCIERARAKEEPADAPAIEAGDRPFERRVQFPKIAGYTLLRELGRGGQAVVYQALQESTHRKVALKVLLEGPYASASAKRRFEREVELASHLKHPNIIAVFDSGTTDSGQPFYVMDYVRAVPITQYVRDNTLSLEKVLELFAVACDAVNHAHQKGVIHRDLKPSNMLVDAEGNLHILDFGLAKAVTDRQETLATVTGQVMGTLPYMSPEQTKGNPDLIDTRADVYALGVVLYEMLTGSYPYPVLGEMAEVLKHIASTEPAPLTRSWTTASGISRSARIRSGCPINDEVETITLKALSKERERRYQSAGEVARDIRHYLANEPIEAKRDSGMYVLRKTLRRYRVPVAMALAFAVILVAATVVLSVALRTVAAAKHNLVLERDNTRKERDRANGNAELAGKHAEEATRNARGARDALAATGESLLLQRQFAAARRSFLECRRLSESLGLPQDQSVAGLLDSYSRVGASLLGFEEDAPSTAFAGHSGPVMAIAWSPDGRMALSAGGSLSEDRNAGGDKAIRIWDAAKGVQKAKLLGHSGTVRAAAFLPDGRRVISASTDGTVRLWDAQTGSELRVLASVPEIISSLAVSKDGNTVVFGSYSRDFLSKRDASGHLRVYDLPLGQERIRLKGNPGRVHGVAISPDGRYATTVGFLREVRVWDLQSGEQRIALKGNGNIVNAVAISPDGQFVAAGGWDRRVRVWRLDNELPLTELDGHDGAIESIAFTPSGQSRLLTGATDQTVKYWDITNRREITTFMSHTGPVASVSFSPDGRSALSAGHDGKIHLLDLSTEISIVRNFQSPVSKVAVSSDGRMLACATRLGIRLLDAHTGQQLQTFTDPGTPAAIPYAVTFFAKHDKLLVGNHDGTIVVWDLRSGKRLAQLVGHKGRVQAITVCHDDAICVSGGDDTAVRVWDLEKGTLLRALAGHTDQVCSVAVSPDGTAIASAGDDGAILLWDLQYGRQTQRLLGHVNLVHEAVFVDHGRRILSIGFDQKIRLWDLASATNIATWTGTGHFGTSLTVSANGRYAVSGAIEPIVRLWDAVTGEHIHAFKGHTNNVESVAFAPDNTTFYSGSWDGTVRRWDMAAPDTYRRFQKSVCAAINTLRASPSDARALVTLAEWYAFRGCDRWAADLLEESAQHGGTISSLMLARCYWRLGRLSDAHRLFGNAIAQKEAPEDYLLLCRAAVAAAMERERTSNITIGASDDSELSVFSEFTRACRAAMASNTNNHWPQFQYACLLVHQGALEQHRMHCNAMLKKFSDTSDRAIADRVAKASLFVPQANIDLARACELADRSVAGPAHQWSHYFQLTKALAEYRSGRFQAAGEWASKSASATRGGNAVHAFIEASLVLSMAQQRTGRLAEASKAFKEAVDGMDRILQPGQKGFEGGFHDWIICQALRKEAEALVKGVPATVPATQPARQ